MRYLWWFLLSILPLQALGQQIKNVRGEQTYDDQIVVYYDMVDAAPSVSYTVELEILQADLTPLVTPRMESMRGDVGADIKPGSNLKITWDALNDISSLVGNRVFLIRATRQVGESNGEVYTGGFDSQPTGGDDFKPTEPVAKPRLRIPRTGSFGRAKDFLDGGFLHLGLSSHKFDNPVYKANESSELLSNKVGLVGSFTGVYLPLLVQFSGFLHGYDVQSPRVVDNHVRYYGADMGLSVCPTPFSKYVVPTIGAGYRMAVLSADVLDANDAQVYSQMDVSTLFISAGLHFCIPMSANAKPANRWVIGAEVKQSLGTDTHKWQHAVVYLGFGGLLFDD